MKIIGKIHDYYDTAAAYGVDETLILKRTTQEFPFDRDDLGKVTGRTLHWDYLTAHHYKFMTGFVLFCGVSYPFVKIVSDNEYPTKTYTFYNINQIEKFMDGISKGFSKSKTWLATKSRWWWNMDFTKVYLQKLFDSTLNEEYILNMSRKFDTPYMVIESYDRREYQLVVYPRLKDYSFGKVKDAYTAHQDVQGYYFGVVGSKENEMIEIEDEYRVEGHGFDMKYGFRKRPRE